MNDTLRLRRAAPTPAPTGGKPPAPAKGPHPLTMLANSYAAVQTRQGPRFEGCVLSLEANFLRMKNVKIFAKDGATYAVKWLLVDTNTIAHVHHIVRPGDPKQERIDDLVAHTAEQAAEDA
jgi:hypothetical protein